jgi:hypothetical protein
MAAPKKYPDELREHGEDGAGDPGSGTGKSTGDRPVARQLV